MSGFFDRVLQHQRQVAALPDRFVKGVVTAVSPIPTVRLDTDPTADTTVADAYVPLRVGQRVWVQLHGTQVVVIGALTPTAAGDTREVRRVGKDEITASTSNSTSIYNAGTITLPPSLAVNGYEFRMTWKGNLNPDTAGAYTDLQLKAGINANTGGTVLDSMFVDHRAAGRSHGVVFTAEFTHTLGYSTGMNIVMTATPSGGGSALNASSTRKVTMTLDWIMP
jgi:hypothetical protein